MAKNVTRDLTIGSPGKLVAEFMLPLWGGLLFQQFYNMVDTMIVGKYLGVNALAGVGSTGAISFLVLGLCIGTCNGFVIPVAQKFGEGNYSELRRCIANSTFLCLLLAAVITAATTLLCSNILQWMHTPEETFSYAYDYIFVIFLGIPALILYNFTSGIIRSLGDSRTPIYFLILSSLLNIVLDLISVTVLHMGVEGPAWATVISQGISGLLCLVIIPGRYPILRFEPGEWQPDLHRMMHITAIGIPMGLQYSITAIGSVVVQTAANGLDTSAIAALASGTKVGQVFASFFDSAGTTMAVYGGQNYGGQKLERLHPGVRACSWICMAYSVVVIGMVLLWGDQMALIFMDSSTAPELRTAVAQMAQEYLLWNSIAYPLLAFVNILRFMIQGLGFTQQAIFAGVFEMVARCFVGFVLVHSFAYTAICAANPLAWLAADLFLFPAYFHDVKVLRKQFNS